MHANRRLLVALLLVTACAGGCASRGSNEALPEAQACAQSVPAAPRSPNYRERLVSLKLRASRVEECMTAHGLVFDETALEKKLQYEEWVRESDVMAGDPQQRLMLMEQELRASPALWKRPTPGS
jgi:hypothetical protein